MPTSIDAAINLDDLRKLAKRRLPKLAYDFIEGGLDDEDGLARNEDAFKRIGLVPRYGVDVTKRDQSTTIFGRTYSGPVGIAPTGGAGLFRRGGDMMLAEAARGRQHALHHVGRRHRLDRGPRPGRARPRLVPALRRQGPQDLRGHDPARRRRRPLDPGRHRRRARSAPTASATGATASCGR